MTREVRSTRADITQELEATRQEIARGTLAMPREVEAQSSAIRRVVGDQLKAIAALESVSQRDNLDVAPALTTRRETPAPRPAAMTAPPPAARPAAQPVAAPAPRPAVAPRVSADIDPPANGGWLSNLLNKASQDERAPRRATGTQPPTATEGSGDTLGALASDIGRLVDAGAQRKPGSARWRASGAYSPASSTRCRDSRPSMRCGGATSASRSSRMPSTAMWRSSTAFSAPWLMTATARRPALPHVGYRQDLHLAGHAAGRIG